MMPHHTVSSDRKSDVLVKLCSCNLLFYSGLEEIKILKILASDQIVTSLSCIFSIALKKCTHRSLLDKRIDNGRQYRFFFLIPCTNYSFRILL